METNVGLSETQPPVLAFSHSWFSSPLPFPLALSTTLFPVSYISVKAFSFGVGLDRWKLRADGSESVMSVSVFKFYRISNSRTPGIGQSILDCHLVSRLLLTSITTGGSAGQSGPTSCRGSPVRLAGEGKLSILGEGLTCVKSPSPYIEDAQLPQVLAAHAP